MEGISGESKKNRTEGNLNTVRISDSKKDLQRVAICSKTPPWFTSAGQHTDLTFKFFEIEMIPILQESCHFGIHNKGPKFHVSRNLQPFSHNHIEVERIGPF